MISKTLKELTWIWSQFGKAEQIAIDVFKGMAAGSVSTNKIRDYLISSPIQIDFLFLEGTLKADLFALDFFSCKQIKYYKSHRSEYCKFAEFFINAAKFDHKVSIFGIDFPLDKYIVPLKADKAYFPVCRSIVLFPKSYIEMCSISGDHANSLKSYFDLKGGLTEEEITVWDLTYKEDKK